MAFYVYEGLIVNVILIASYVVIYRRLRTYHQDLIDYNDMSPEEVEELRISLRYTGTFFALIGQHLVVWTAYEICQLVGACIA